MSNSSLHSEALKRYSQQSKSGDGLSLFWRKSQWAKETKFKKHYLEFLGAPAAEYFSPLKAAFSHDFENPEDLCFFSPLLLRDGLLTLLKFFFQQPKPSSKDQIILVSSQLGAIVPAEWKNNTLLCSYHTNQPALQLSNKIKRIILLFSVYDEFQASSVFISETAEEIHQKILALHSPPEIFCSFSGTFSKTNRDEYDRKTQYQFELMQKLYSLFGTKLKYLPLAQVTEGSHEQSAFFEINPHNFYVSDNFLVQRLLGQGAFPLNMSGINNKRVHSLNSSKRIELPMSLFHKAIVEPNFLAESKEADLINKIISDFKSSPVLMQEENDHQTEKSLLPCSASFFELAKNIGDILSGDSLG